MPLESPARRPATALVPTIETMLIVACLATSCGRGAPAPANPSPPAERAPAAPAALERRAAPEAAPTEAAAPDDAHDRPSPEPAASPAEAQSDPNRPREGAAATVVGERSAKPAPKPAAKTGAEQREVGEPTQPAAADTASACGERGQPACPLQGFMERDIQQPLDAGELGKVAAGLRKVVRFVPDASWNADSEGWQHWAELGAAAAQRGDSAATEQTCKGCHKAFRKRYKAEYRKRPLP